MMHDYHDVLPGFSPNQVLHDHCAECESRAASADHGLGHLDTGNFQRAWARAAAWNGHGLRDVARAEMPLLNTLWSVQVQMERLGVPLGTLPSLWAGEPR